MFVDSKNLCFARYGETGANDDLPSVCDIGTVIKSVTKIDIADSAMDLHSIMSLPSYRSALDRKFYGVPRGNAPDISLKVSEIALLLFKYKSYTLSHSGSVNMNAELWCLNRGRMVYRAVTKTATNDKYPCWKDVLQYTYSSDASGGIIDELVIILCDHQEGNLRNTFKDIPLCYARVSVSAIDICLNVRESVQLHPILLSEDEWMKCITNQVLPNEIKRKTRSIFSRRSATSSQRHSAGSMQSSVSESEIGELRISFSGWISRK